VRRDVAFAILSVVVTLGCIGGSQTSSTDTKPAAAKPVEKIERKISVVVTTGRIAKKLLLRRQDLEKVEFPESKIPKGERPKNIAEVTGSKATIDIEQGAVLLKSMYAKEVIRGLSDMVSGGNRAVAISMDAARAVPFLQQGHRVDVIGTFGERNAKGEGIKVTRILFQNVLVLAVGARFAPRPGSKTLRPKGSDTSKDKKKKSSVINPFVAHAHIPCVVLEIPPEQANVLALAESASKLHLAICSKGGLKSHEGYAVTDQLLLAQDQDDVEDPNSQDELEVTVTRGSKETVQYMQLTEQDRAFDYDADAPLRDLRSQKAKDDPADEGSASSGIKSDEF